MGHWTNSKQQVLSAASGVVTRVNFDQEIIAGSQTVVQDGVYDYSYHLNLAKPSGEIGPSRVVGVLDIKRAGGSIDLIRESRSFADIDTGTEEFLAHMGQTPLSVGDEVRVRVNLDDLSQNGVLMTRIKAGQSSLSLNLMGASASGNFAGDTFPTAGIEPGSSFYRTDLDEQFHYTGTKWLGLVRIDGAGRSGGQAGNAYFRRFNGLIMTATRGIHIPFDITIKRISWTKEDTATGTIQVQRDGVVLGVAGANARSGSSGLDIDFDGGASLSLFWLSTNATSNVQISIEYRRRG